MLSLSLLLICMPCSQLSSRCHFSCCFHWQYYYIDFSTLCPDIIASSSAWLPRPGRCLLPFCEHKSISLNNLSPSLLSVTWKTILSLSISFSVISGCCCYSFCLGLTVYMSIPFVTTWWGKNWCCSNTMFNLGLQGFLNIFKTSSKINLSSSCSVDTMCW